jgi:prepilin-type N-terminal cleavage/methylation domain-containing protein
MEMACRTRSINPPAGAPRRNRGGFTLAESMIASVVLAIAVVAVSGAIVASQAQNTTQIEDTIALNLARQLMEEIVAVPLATADSSCWPNLTDRSQYDRVNDLAGYTDIVKVPLRRGSGSGLAGTIDLDSARPSVTVVTSGNPTLSSEKYKRQVTITYPTTPFAGATVTAGDFALVKVTVTGPEGNVVTLTRLIGNSTVTR